MLPKQLKFGSKVESAAAKSSRVNILPNNGTGPYSLGDTIIINIPTRQNLVLVPNESYLKFTLGAITASAAAAIRWDIGGAGGIIQKIRIYHGSNLLQDIDNYGLLSKMLFDIQAPGDATYGKLNVLAGTRSDLVINLLRMQRLSLQQLIPQLILLLGLLTALKYLLNKSIMARYLQVMLVHMH